MTSGIKFEYEQVKEYISSFGYTLVDDFYIGQRVKMKISDESGYLYSLTLNRFSNAMKAREGFRIVDVKANTYSFYNIKKWISENRKDLSVVSTEYPGNTEKMKFMCLRDGCGEVFYSKWDCIFGGSGCPYCRGLKVGERNSLYAVFPEIAKDWDYGKNYPLTPLDVSHGSGKMFFWVCNLCGCEWRATVSNRTTRKSKCPGCSKKQSADDRSITRGLKNSIAKNRPDLAEDWSDMNEISPEFVSVSSARRFWWKCSFGHPDYQRRPCDRSRHRFGCPLCFETGGESRIRKFLEKSGINFEAQAKLMGCSYVRPLMFDFFIPRLNICIEYNGEQHYRPIEFFGGEKSFKKQVDKDNIKRKYCEENNIGLIEIGYYDYENVETILSESISV